MPSVLLRGSCSASGHRCLVVVNTHLAAVLHPQQLLSNMGLGSIVPMMLIIIGSGVDN